MELISTKSVTDIIGIIIVHFFRLLDVVDDYLYFLTKRSYLLLLALKDQNTWQYLVILLFDFLDSRISITCQRISIFVGIRCASMK